ncbi:AraC family transcriptional regulator [Anaeromicrobium sediminis]|uniref:HTH araC/xylS-type domain-containing protein n=1 Tax=Anaeromicrobium sediminis TaxID=1478221 RepID=A0A267MN58_9FIRM|nr:AraC family transcriptional regulator [Anaeromicrobium sediminis]PAB61034.1 hypothetical protein CCE28_00970 [Anaeromicrobium sediminis]
MIKICLSKVKDSIFRNESGPNLSYVCKVCDEPKWFYSMHMHKHLSEIVYIKEGKGNFIINNVHYEVQKGDIVIFNKEVLHQESSDPKSPLKTIVLGVEDIFIKGIDDNCIISNNVCPIIKAGPHSYKVEKYMLEIFEESLTQAEGFDLICHNLLRALITLITRLALSHENIESHDLESLAYKIKLYIDENYMYDIKLKDLANKFYISPSYLAHIVKKELGFSPIRYLMDRRIGEAQKHLLSTDLSVSKISRLVGYTNVNYFNNLFKKTIGLSPGKFRDMYETNKGMSK